MISIEPRDEQVDKIEDFIEFLTCFDLSKLPENRRDGCTFKPDVLSNRFFGKPFFWGG